MNYCHLSKLKVFREGMGQIWDAWIIFQMYVNGLNSNNGSITTLELIFIHNLSIPYWTSNCQWSSKGGATQLNSSHPNIFYLQYQVFNTSRCLAKLSSQSCYNSYCGYTMPMASNNAHFEKKLSNSLINLVATPMDQCRQKENTYLSIQNPKLITHQHSIHLNQNQNSLRKLTWTFWLHLWNQRLKRFLNHNCPHIWISIVMHGTKLFIEFTMKVNCSLESFKSTTYCTWMWSCL
jgi:hypothetical protein